MNYINPENDLEIMVSNQSILNLRGRILDIKNKEEFLKSKKFHLGDIVEKVNSNQLDLAFGCAQGSIGKIVGWDYEYQYYRVRYNERNPYIGVKEEELRLYTGKDIPKDLIDFDPYSFEGLGYRKTKMTTEG